MTNDILANISGQITDFSTYINFRQVSKYANVVSHGYLRELPADVSAKLVTEGNVIDFISGIARIETVFLEYIGHNMIIITGDIMCTRGGIANCFRVIDDLFNVYALNLYGKSQSLSSLCAGNQYVSRKLANESRSYHICQS